MQSNNLFPCRGIHPKLGENVWLAPTSNVIGEVIMGDNCSVWFNAVVRADVGKIIIGNNSNIQDGAVIHCTYKKTDTIIGNNVSIAHNAIVHGATIEDNVLIGMNTVIMDNVTIPSNVVIGAGSIVRANDKLESNYIYAGNPLKKLKPINDKWEEIIAKTASNYIEYATWY